MSTNTARPPYAAAVYRCLATRTPARTRLLDLGCGEGKIARPMSGLFEQVVAVDPSENMIELGQRLEKGRAANIEWICASAENAPITGRFDLVTFASSIHWMDPKQLFEKLQPHLAPDHRIAVISGDEAFDPPWAEDWRLFLEKWVPLANDLPMGAQEWQANRNRYLAYVDRVETHAFISEPFSQSIEAFILAQQSRNTFALAKLGQLTPTFQSDLRDLLTPYADRQGRVSFRVKTHLSLSKLK